MEDKHPFRQFDIAAKPLTLRAQLGEQFDMAAQPPAHRARLAEALEREDLRHELATPEDYWCGDCGVIDGELHTVGCDMEQCPWCGEQLISCGCCEERLGIENPFDMTDDEEFRWSEMLDQKGRVPFIHYPHLCRRCGAINPDTHDGYWRGGEEWCKYVPLANREDPLCNACFERIKALIDTRKGGLKRPS